MQSFIVILRDVIEEFVFAEILIRYFIWFNQTLLATDIGLTA